MSEESQEISSNNESLESLLNNTLSNEGQLPINTKKNNKKYLWDVDETWNELDDFHVNRILSEKNHPMFEMLEDDDRSDPEKLKAVAQRYWYNQTSNNTHEFYHPGRTAVIEDFELIDENNTISSSGKFIPKVNPENTYLEDIKKIKEIPGVDTDNTSIKKGFKYSTTSALSYSEQYDNWHNDNLPNPNLAFQPPVNLWLASEDEIKRQRDRSTYFEETYGNDARSIMEKEWPGLYKNIQNTIKKGDLPSWKEVYTHVNNSSMQLALSPFLPFGMDQVVANQISPIEEDTKSQNHIFEGTESIKDHKGYHLIKTEDPESYPFIDSANMHATTYNPVSDMDEKEIKLYIDALLAKPGEFKEEEYEKAIQLISNIYAHGYRLYDREGMQIVDPILPTKNSDGTTGKFFAQPDKIENPAMFQIWQDYNRTHTLGDVWEDFAEEPSKFLPWISSANEGAELYQIYQLAERINNDTMDQLTDEDAILLYEWLVSNAHKGNDTFWAGVGQTVFDMIPFMGEMATSYGIGAVATTSGKKIFMSIASKKVKDMVQKKLGKKITKKVTVGRVFEETARLGIQHASINEIQVPTSESIMNLDWKSEWYSKVERSKIKSMLPGFTADPLTQELIYHGSGHDEVTAEKIGRIDEYIESLSESTGYYIMGPLFGKFSKITNKYIVAKSAWLQALMKKNPLSTFKGTPLQYKSNVKAYLSAVGYDGILEEMLEEEVGRGARHMTHVLAENGVLDPGLAEAGFEWETPTAEEYMQQLVAFALPAGVSASSSVYENYKNKEFLESDIGKIVVEENKNVDKELVEIEKEINKINEDIENVDTETETEEIELQENESSEETADNWEEVSDEVTGEADAEVEVEETEETETKEEPKLNKRDQRKLDRENRKNERKKKRLDKINERKKEIQERMSDAKKKKSALLMTELLARQNPGQFDDAGSLDIINKIQDITVDDLKARGWDMEKIQSWFKGEGMPGDTKIAQITGSTEWKQLEGELKVLVSLYRGATADTVLEEFYGLAYRQQTKEQRATWDEYYSQQNTDLTSQEFFEKEGKKHFVSNNTLVSQQGGVIVKTWEKLKSTFKDMFNLHKDKLDPRIRTMYDNAGLLKFGEKITDTTSPVQGESILTQEERKPGDVTETVETEKTKETEETVENIEDKSFQIVQKFDNIEESEGSVVRDKVDINDLKDFKLPGGSTRDVYIVGKDEEWAKVIKVAKNPKGIEQNASIDFGDKQMLGSWIPKLYEKGLDYIAVEYVPRNDKMTRKFLKPLKEFSPIDWDRKDRKLQDVMNELGLEDFLSYDLLWNDFISYRNWGVRTLESKVTPGVFDGSNEDAYEMVLIDEGAVNPRVHATSEVSDWAKQDWKYIKEKEKRYKQFIKNQKDNLKGFEEDTKRRIFKKYDESSDQLQGEFDRAGYFPPLEDNASYQIISKENPLNAQSYFFDKTYDLVTKGLPKSLGYKDLHKWLLNNGISAKELELLNMDLFFMNHEDTKGKVDQADLLQYLLNNQNQIRTRVAGSDLIYLSKGYIETEKDGDVSRRYYFDRSDFPSGRSVEGVALQDHHFHEDINEQHETMVKSLIDKGVVKFQSDLLFVDAMTENTEYIDDAMSYDVYRQMKHIIKDKWGRHKSPGFEDDVDQYYEIMVNVSPHLKMEKYNDHWDDINDNTFMHVRFTIRHNPMDGRYMLVEEVQSDYEQQVGAKNSKLKQIRKQQIKANKTLTDKFSKPVPNTPYSSYDYMGLGAKVAIKHGAKLGINKIYFTTGAEQTITNNALHLEGVDKIEYQKPDQFLEDDIYNIDNWDIEKEETDGGRNLYYVFRPKKILHDKYGNLLNRKWRIKIGTFASKASSNTEKSTVINDLTINEYEAFEQFISTRLIEHRKNSDAKITLKVTKTDGNVELINKTPSELASVVGASVAKQIFKGEGESQLYFKDNEKFFIRDKEIMREHDIAQPVGYGSIVHQMAQGYEALQHIIPEDALDIEWHAINPIIKRALIAREDIGSDAEVPNLWNLPFWDIYIKFLKAEIYNLKNPGSGFENERNKIAQENPQNIHKIKDLESRLESILYHKSKETPMDIQLEVIKKKPENWENLGAEKTNKNYMYMTLNYQTIEFEYDPSFEEEGENYYLMGSGREVRLRYLPDSMSEIPYVIEYYEKGKWYQTEPIQSFHDVKFKYDPVFGKNARTSHIGNKNWIMFKGLNPFNKKFGLFSDGKPGNVRTTIYHAVQGRGVETQIHQEIVQFPVETRLVILNDTGIGMEVFDTWKIRENTSYGKPGNYIKETNHVFGGESIYNSSNQTGTAVAHVNDKIINDYLEKYDLSEDIPGWMLVNTLTKEDADIKSKNFYNTIYDEILPGRLKKLAKLMGLEYGTSKLSMPIKDKQSTENEVISSFLEMVKYQVNGEINDATETTTEVMERNDFWLTQHYTNGTTGLYNQIIRELAPKTWMEIKEAEPLSDTMLPANPGETYLNFEPDIGQTLGGMPHKDIVDVITEIVTGEVSGKDNKKEDAFWDAQLDSRTRSIEMVYREESGLWHLELTTEMTLDQIDKIRKVESIWATVHPTGPGQKPMATVTLSTWTNDQMHQETGLQMQTQQQLSERLDMLLNLERPVITLGSKQEEIASNPMPSFQLIQKEKEILDNENSFDLSETTQWNWFLFGVQDEMIRMQIIQENIGNVPEHLDVYLKNELMPGATAENVETFREWWRDDFLKKMFSMGVGVQDFGDYLYFRHAGERNLHILKKNADDIEKLKQKIKESKTKKTKEKYIEMLEKLEAKGSGVTQEQIEEYEENLTPEQAEAYNELALEFDEKVIQKSRKMLLDNGIINEDTEIELDLTFDYYVPLKGIAGKDTFSGVSRGDGVRGSTIQSAFGRTSIANNPFAQALADMEHVIATIEKNKVFKTLHDIIVENPHEMWRVRGLQFLPNYDKEGNMTLIPKDKDLKGNEVAVRIDGKTVIMELNDKMLRMALKGREGTMNEWLQKRFEWLRHFNQFFRSVNTSLRPTFIINNFMRDSQTAGLHMSEKMGLSDILKTYGGVVGAIRGIYRSSRGKPSKWNKWYKEFKEDGGKVGWMDQTTVEQKLDDIQYILQALDGNHKTKETIYHIGQWVEDTNMAVENGVRLAVYRKMRESGNSREKSAQFAKNLTVNFNKKGVWGPNINLMYIFSNAGIQGSARFLGGLAKNKRSRKIIYAITGLSFLNSFLQRLIDPDDWDALAKWKKDTQMQFQVPGMKDNLKINLGYGLNVPWAIGNIMEDHLASQKWYQDMFGFPIGSGEQDGWTSAFRVLESMNHAFNPFGGDLNQAIYPTIAKPIYQWGNNVDWKGDEYKKTQNYFNAPDEHPHLMHFPHVQPMSKDATQYIYDETGLSINPADIDHFIRSYGGGLSKDMQDIFNGAYLGVKEGELPVPENWPVFSSVFTTGNEPWSAKKIFKKMHDKRKIHPFDEQDLHRYYRNGAFAVRKGGMTKKDYLKQVKSFRKKQFELIKVWHPWPNEIGYDPAEGKLK